MSHTAVVIPGVDRIAGAEQQAMLLAKGLRRRGWRVSMVALSGSGGAAADGIAECRRGIRQPRNAQRACGPAGMDSLS